MVVAAGSIIVIRVFTTVPLLPSPSRITSSKRRRRRATARTTTRATTTTSTGEVRFVHSFERERERVSGWKRTVD